MYTIFNIGFKILSEICINKFDEIPAHPGDAHFLNLLLQPYP